MMSRWACKRHSVCTKRHLKRHMHVQGAQIASLWLQMRDTEAAADSDFEDAALMGMSPDVGFTNPKLPQQYLSSRFAPTTPLPASQAHAFRGRDWQNSTMISNHTQK